MTTVVVNEFGWAGVVIILVCYGLNVLGILATNDWLYLAGNALGSVGILVSSLRKRDLQPAVLNAVWLLIALAGMWRALNG